MDRPMTDEEFLNALHEIKKVTISAKLRDFQFRLSHKRIPTNKELARWKIKTSDQCP